VPGVDSRRKAPGTDSTGTSVSAGNCRHCAAGKSAVARCRSIGNYDGTLRAILHAFKYDGCRSLATGLGEHLSHVAADVLHRADVVVPVPLHFRKERVRGFNQARELAHALGLPLLDVLRRTRHTPTQTGLSAPERKANVCGAFGLRRNMDVAGLRVVLVDDVSTTGATMEACAEVLRGAGAADVSAVTAARVVSRPPE
jgi:ComF family protein